MNWVYDMDAEYSLPYQNAVGALYGRPSFEAGKNNLVHRVQMLAKLSNFPAVRNNLDLINRLQSDGFWKEITLPGLEHIRTELRELMKFSVMEGTISRTKPLWWASLRPLSCPAPRPIT